jgi:hypothetical protein
MAIPCAASRPWKNLQLVMKHGKVFNLEIKATRELCQGRTSLSRQQGDFSVARVRNSLDFGCAVGIMRQSRSPVRTGVGFPVLVADSRKEGL